jgi:hypothetical protein
MVGRLATIIAAFPTGHVIASHARGATMLNRYSILAIKIQVR